LQENPEIAADIEAKVRLELLPEVTGADVAETAEA